MILSNIKMPSEARKLWAFSTMLQGPNYFPFIRCQFFDYDTYAPVDYNFTMDNLRQTLSHLDNINGEIKPCTFADLETLVNTAFTWDVDISGTISQLTNTTFPTDRSIIFWDILYTILNQKNYYFYGISGPKISFPFDHCFVHIPAQDCYFTKTDLWSFCFVILSDSQGLVVHGKTWNNKTLCIPECEDEYSWRKNCRLL